MKRVFQKKYKKPGMQINKEYLPFFKHFENQNVQCLSAHIMEEGLLECDGEERTYEILFITVGERGIKNEKQYN